MTGHYGKFECMYLGIRHHAWYETSILAGYSLLRDFLQLNPKHRGHGRFSLYCWYHMILASIMHPCILVRSRWVLRLPTVAVEVEGVDVQVG